MCACQCTESFLTLSDPMGCSPPGSSVHGIFQVRILEWVTIFSSKRASQPRDQTGVSCIAGGFFTTEPGGTPNPIHKCYRIWVQFAVSLWWKSWVSWLLWGSNAPAAIWELGRDNRWQGEVWQRAAGRENLILYPGSQGEASGINLDQSRASKSF